MERRNFFKASSALFGLGIISTTAFLESCSKNDLIVAPQEKNLTSGLTLDLTQPSNSALNSTGGSIVSNSIIVINLGSSFVAFSQICTHQGCSVGFNSSSNRFVCPCHGSIYDISGSVVSGPAPSPLKKYSVAKNGNTLTIS